jgi:hypothetical protein
MDVFVIPVGRDRYELYCEATDESAVPDDAPEDGLLGRVQHKAIEMLRSVEAEHRAGNDDGARRGLVARIRQRIVGWMAERIAEQRLLWNLRRTTAAVAAHPGDMSDEQVIALVRRLLQGDYDRHRKWSRIDGVLFVVTFVGLGPLFVIIPGIANLPALYFGFVTILHVLSMRGALHGLRRVSWTGRVCPPLAELRGAAALEPEARGRHVRDIAARLRLPHLPRFFERVAMTRA